MSFSCCFQIFCFDVGCYSLILIGYPRFTQRSRKTSTNLCCRVKGKDISEPAIMSSRGSPLELSLFCRHSVKSHSLARSLAQSINQSLSLSRHLCCNPSYIDLVSNWPKHKVTECNSQNPKLQAP